jgi:hypothetical protein
MIKVLGLALYGSLAASTRVRIELYAPGLREHGIDLHVSLLLDNDYVRRRFNSQSVSWGTLLQAGAQRLSLQRQAKQFDLPMLYCELFSLMPSRLERKLVGLP